MLAELRGRVAGTPHFNIFTYYDSQVILLDFLASTYLELLRSKLQNHPVSFAYQPLGVHTYQ